MRKRAMVLGVLFCAALVVRAEAAEGTQSFKSLAADGYEIKAVSLVPMEIAVRGNSTNNFDTAFVTMQKGTSVAVCYFGFGNWVSLNQSTLENGELCQVR